MSAKEEPVRFALSELVVPTDALIDPFRMAFFETRKQLIAQQGLESFDQAQVLYRGSQSGRKVAVRDAYAVNRGDLGVLDFLEHLRVGWWQERQQFKGEGDAQGELQPVAGLYARYLPEVGFDYCIEFQAQGPIRAFRMNARGRVWPLVLPEDDQMLYDQTGTWLSARAAWRALVAQYHRTAALQLAEVQAGYVIGVRAGVPGDDAPAEREDPALEEAMQPWLRTEFDTLEFLNTAEALQLPLAGRRYTEWLDADDLALAHGGQIELFVLADASEFLSCIEDVAKEYGVAVAWLDPEDDLRVAFVRDDVRVERDFAEYFLGALHCGQSFVEGAQFAYGATVRAVADAAELAEVARAALGDFRVSVELGGVLVVRDEADRGLARAHLMSLASRSPMRGRAHREAFLNYLGWDEEAGRFRTATQRLGRCPVTGEPARITKLVRPKAAMTVDARTLAGVDMGSHFTFFAHEGPSYTTPIELDPAVEQGALEAAYRAGLAEAKIHIVQVRALDGAWLYCGFDVGSLVLEPARVVALLNLLEGPAAMTVTALALHPDVLLLSEAPLTQGPLGRARAEALALAQTYFPGREYGLGLARTLELEGLEPVGHVELEG